MNLGQRISGALAALSGDLSASVAANTTADADFRTATEATLTALGTTTTSLKEQIDGLAAQVEAGEAIDPAVFADIKSKVDSLDAAFPDEVAQPPEDDEVEDEHTVPASDAEGGDASGDVAQATGTATGEA